jgi:transposase, IS5 family
MIGHLKAEHRMGRNHLDHRAGDAINAMLAAVGYNFRLLLPWLRLLLRVILAAQIAPPRLQVQYHGLSNPTR